MFSKFFILLATVVTLSYCLVAFEPFQNPACNLPMWNTPRIYFPITDRRQGIDSQVASVIYGGNPPSTFGNWSVINSTTATLCSITGSCQSWTVWPNLTIAQSECVNVPPFGWGRFYNTGRSNGAIELRRTTGQGTFWEPSVCRNTISYQWVAYLHSPIDSSSAPCSNNTFVNQVFWDGGDKLTFYLAGGGEWTQPQPCGDAPYPGEKCFKDGRGYCTKNANCAIDHDNKPDQFPFSGPQSTTVKIVTENRVGSISDGAYALVACIWGMLVAVALTVFL